MSGDETDLGRHISDVDGALFHSLAEKDRIFSAQPIKDYQVSFNVKYTCIPCLLSNHRLDAVFFGSGEFFKERLTNCLEVLECIFALKTQLFLLSIVSALHWFKIRFTGKFSGLSFITDSFVFFVPKVFYSKQKP